MRDRRSKLLLCVATTFSFEWNKKKNLVLALTLYYYKPVVVVVVATAAAAAAVVVVVAVVLHCRFCCRRCCCCSFCWNNRNQSNLNNTGKNVIIYLPFLLITSLETFQQKQWTGAGNSVCVYLPHARHDKPSSRSPKRHFPNHPPLSTRSV